MLTALQRVAGENPAFWLRGARARALVSSIPHNEADLLLRDKSAALGLRALLVEQLSDVALAEPFRKTLRELLLDSNEVSLIRRQAGDALANLNGEDWPTLIDDLRVQGDTEEKRLAFELMQAIGCPSFSDTQIVEVVLAYDGLTACPWPRRSDDGIVVRFWRFADSVPVDRLDGILETLTAYVRELLPEHPGDSRNTISSGSRTSLSFVGLRWATSNPSGFGHGCRLTRTTGPRMEGGSRTG